MGIKKKDVKTVNTWMNTKKITPAQFITAMVAVLIFVWFNTTIFHNLPDAILVSVYIAMIIISVLLDFKKVDLKAFAVAIKNIWIDPSLSGWARITKIFSLVIPLLIEANEEFDMLNLEQFKDLLETPVNTSEPLYSGTATTYIDPEYTSSTGAKKKE